MNIVLLSGGSGKRLWPLSNDVRSKQFIKIFRNGDAYESMVQRMYKQIKAVDPYATITIATSKSQVSAIHNQVGLNVNVSVEPCRRDTFAAIALATAYLHDVKGLSIDDAIVVCPVDQFVEESYFRTLENMCYTAQHGNDKLVLMGIEPTYPSEKYGYIKPVELDGKRFWCFTEKPKAEKAAEYIASGALWNGGVFAYKLSYVLEKSKELLGTCDYKTLFNGYSDLKKISFDYAVVEHETSIGVIRYSGIWEDIGTWNALSKVLEDQVVGNGMLGAGCNNVHIINELGIPILAMGLKNTVIAASPDGILVSTEETADRIRPFADAINQQIMYAEKSWGSYQVINVGHNSITVKATLNPGHMMSYHSHDRRDEVWTIISGTGLTIVDGIEQPVKAGDVITIDVGCKHTIIADSELQLIEVQLGDEISVTDKHKFELGGGKQFYTPCRM